MQPTQIKNENRSLNVRMRLFWEYKISAIDWEEHADAIMQRVLERGNPGEWEELVLFYGRERIVHSLKERIPWFAGRTIGPICSYFELDAKELKCYEARQSNPGLWPY